MPVLPPRAFTLATALLLLGSTALIGLGVERLAHGAPLVGYVLLAAGIACAIGAFSLRVEGDARRVTLLLVTRQECLLCDEARAILRHVQGDSGFSFWEVDADQHPMLRDAYGGDLPVLVRDGRPVATLRISEADVRAILD